MIVSASYRTDIPAFHGAWFLNRLAAGWAAVRNPYGGGVSRVALDRGAVDGFVFWTKNIGPFLDGLDAVAARGHPFVVQHSVTSAPRALERSAPAPDKAVADIRAVARRFGRRAVVWRYDPIVISDLMPADAHRAAFVRLAAALAGSVDEVTLSFVQPYRKTARNLGAAAAAHGFAWRDPPADEKTALLAGLGEIARDHDLSATLCAQPELLVDGLAAARCVDARRLSDVAGREIGARRKGNRPGCLCAESRDIGAYDTCPMGCVYCYAVRDRDRAAARRAAHDPASDTL
ncbi:MAG: DUF1848 domain-containing protein [Rhodospirillales bacterium]|nr:DUF1848 domain-containing protein [Rhodospirillales bacterium]